MTVHERGCEVSTMILPLKVLRAACAAQRSIVRREWPLGVPLTPLTAQRAVELGLDLEWIADHLLDAPAWADYKRVRAPAKADYDRATAPAWENYTRVSAKAKAEPAHKWQRTCHSLTTCLDHPGSFANIPFCLRRPHRLHQKCRLPNRTSHTQFRHNSVHHT